MKRSIESIWKEDFSGTELNQTPTVENLYNQKSMHLVDKLIRMFKVNLIAILMMAIAFWIVFFFLDAIIQGTIVSILLLGLAWYGKQQMKRINKINPSLNSYEYLVSFDQFIKDMISKNISLMRLFYPLIFLTAISVIWFAGNNQIVLTNKLIDTFPNLIFVGDIPLFGLIFVGIVTSLITYFAGSIYKWDVGLIYGRMFKKLQEAIVDLEELMEKGDNRVDGREP